MPNSPSTHDQHDHVPPAVQARIDAGFACTRCGGETGAMRPLDAGNTRFVHTDTCPRTVAPDDGPAAAFTMRPTTRPGAARPAATNPAREDLRRRRRVVLEALAAARKQPGYSSPEVGNTSWLIHQGLPEDLRPDSTAGDEHYRAIGALVETEAGRGLWLDVEAHVNAHQADALVEGFEAGWRTAMAVLGPLHNHLLPGLQSVRNLPRTAADPTDGRAVAEEHLRRSLECLQANLLAFACTDLEEALEMLDDGHPAELMLRLLELDDIRNDAMDNPVEHCRHIAHLARGWAWGDPESYERCCEIGDGEEGMREYMEVVRARHQRLQAGA